MAIYVASQTIIWSTLIANKTPSSQLKSLNYSFPDLSQAVGLLSQAVGLLSQAVGQIWECWIFQVCRISARRALLVLLWSRLSAPKFFNSSILQFFNPSILQFFNPSILQFFNSSILQSFNSSILQRYKLCEREKRVEPCDCTRRLLTICNPSP